MSENLSIPTTDLAGSSSGALGGSWVHRAFRRALWSRLEHLSDGLITLREGDAVRRFGSEGPSGLRAEITVHSPSLYRRLALGGSLAAAETHIDGLWDCDDLVALIRIFLRNRHVADGMDTGWSRLTAPLARVQHLLRRNTRRGSRRNIHEHYDLGNDFFALWLDETMTYSSAIFEREEMTLAEASVAKLERICRKLDLKPSDHVLEIGTGWGSFAIHAAKTHGCRVTTTTISKEQRDLAVKRIAEAGLSDRVEVLLSDYRDLQGEYDKAVSIEMIEAVGHENLGTYFGAIADRLKPEGMAVIQAITMNDQEYDRFRRSVDFIQKHIFPGSCITSIGAMMGAVAKATDFRLFHLEDITPHYTRTLLEWRDRFHAKVEDVRALGYPERFVRLWDHYLCYCAAGFAERHIGVSQLLFTRAACRRAPLTPALERTP
jgi:cyclopropane-fatty-acyl-phospholipid synthase